MTFRSPPAYEPPSKPRRSPLVRLVVLGIILVMVCIPVAAGAGLYLALSGTFDQFGVQGIAAPRLEPPSVEAPTWSSRERVNILILGSDRRAGDESIPRTDTIIVLTLDPQSRTAGMVSLPRDLWVTIPGYGYERINASFELGEHHKPGGGPELTRKTVEQLLGVPVHHYVVVGFEGFQKLVDEVGGVTIDVERPIRDDEYPDQNFSLRRIFFQPGLQRLSGETALWYVRTRHADSDFGRARRQQQFLLALRKQALQLNLLPKAPAILAALGDTFKTDLRPQEMIALANIAKDVDTSRIVSRVIDESMTTHWVTPAGAQVELPYAAAVKQVSQEVFGSSSS
jgi:LCP family protein required for cell wall assembly